MTFQLNQGLIQVGCARYAQAGWQSCQLGLGAIVVGLVWVASGCGVASPQSTLAFNSSDAALARVSLSPSSSALGVAAPADTHAVSMDERTIRGGFGYEDRVAMVGIAAAGAARLYQALQAAVAVLGAATVARILQSYDNPSLGGFALPRSGNEQATTQHRLSEAVLVPPRLGGFVDEGEIAPMVLSQPKDTFSPLMVMAAAGDLAYVPPERRGLLVKLVQHSLDTLGVSIAQEVRAETQRLEISLKDISTQIEQYDQMRAKGELSADQVREVMLSLYEKNETIRNQLQMIHNHFEDQIGKINAIKEMMDQIIHDEAMHSIRKNLESQLD